MRQSASSNAHIELIKYEEMTEENDNFSEMQKQFDKE